VLTVSVWKAALEECEDSYGYYYISFGVAALLTFVSIFTVIVDIIFLPFEVLVFILKIILESILNR
jgi:hypothetical protein